MTVIYHVQNFVSQVRFEIENFATATIGIRKIDERGPETNGTVRSFQLRPRFFKFKFLPLMRRHCVEITRHGMSYCKVNICKKEIYL